MLPDFPKIKRKVNELLTRYLQRLVRADPLLSKIKEQPVFEGNRMSSGVRTGESVFEQISAQSPVKRKDIIEKGLKVYFKSIPLMADEIIKQKTKLLFAKIGQSTQETGNIVDLKGKPLTPERFLELLEKIWIDFDDKGKPHIPTLVVSPETGIQLKQKFAEWAKDPVHERKFEELMERKREEWNDRESNRKLVS